jgi:hypothetical protein
MDLQKQIDACLLKRVKELQKLPVLGQNRVVDVQNIASAGPLFTDHLEDLFGNPGRRRRVLTRSIISQGRDLHDRAG